MHAFRIFLTVLTVGALAACQSDAIEPSSSAPDVVTAFVVAVDSPTDYTRVLVNDGGLLASPGTTRQYSLVVTPATTIFLRQRGGSLVPARAMTGTIEFRCRCCEEMHKGLPAWQPLLHSAMS